MCKPDISIRDPHYPSLLLRTEAVAGRTIAAPSRGQYRRYNGGHKCALVMKPREAWGQPFNDMKHCDNTMQTSLLGFGR